MQKNKSYKQKEYLKAIDKILFEPGLNEYCSILERASSLMEKMLKDNPIEDDFDDTPLEESKKLRAELENAEDMDEIQAIREKIRDRKDISKVLINDDYMNEFMLVSEHIGPFDDMIRDKITEISELETELGQLVSELKNESITKYRQLKDKCYKLKSGYDNKLPEFSLLMIEYGLVKKKDAFNNDKLQREIASGIDMYIN